MAWLISQKPQQTEIRFTDATGNILHSKQLGAQASGLVGFSWENIPTEIVDANEPLRIEAFADFGNGMESLTPSIFAEVLAASTGDEKRRCFRRSRLWRDSCIRCSKV